VGVGLVSVALATGRCARDSTASSRNGVADRSAGGVTMNRKQRVLTIVALAAFGAIIYLHYQKFPLYQRIGYDGNPWMEWAPIFPDFKMPLFVLAVFYAGLFFLLADRKERR
jgi:hypothetical protein